MRLGSIYITVLAALLYGCSLPALEDRSASHILSQEEVLQTRLGKTIQGLRQDSGMDSGVHVLSDAQDAFAARVFLTRLADKTLDVQYYIWRDDITGMLLLDELYQAAERGVRVRLLLDDNGIRRLDDVLAEMNAHPNLEVRLFNPFASRRFKFLGFITDFSRANRRMHNKSFTADQQATIVGGRNIGDEYFAAKDGLLFADLDVMVAGPAAWQVSEDFDRYWASESAWPVNAVFEQKASALGLHQRADRIAALPEAQRYVEALENSGFIQTLLAGDLAIEWVPIRLVSDNPAKGLGQLEESELMIFSLAKLLGIPEKSLDLVSPYFVPTKSGVQVFSLLARQGIRVRILTNALEATDVAAVHSGYAKRRKALLEAGVELYEMRGYQDQPEEGKAGLFGSSSSSLHAKTFSVDNQRIFVGSFNFDPRSAMLNTELGFVIKSSNMAQEMDRIFTDRILQAAYQVRLDEQGKLYWLEQNGEQQIHHHTEPNTSWWLRAKVRVLSWLPIEWLL